MWFSASTKHFVGMNRFGKLEKIIDLGDRFILHHDYALDDDGNIVSLATDLTRSDHAVQDQAIKVNTSTGKVTKLVDFGEMFPDYKASTDHSGIDESDPAASGSWDWIHFNTIQLLPDGQYYINMFDNDFGYAMTRPDYDWTTIADISTAKSSEDKDSRSQYRRYQYDFKGFYFACREDDRPQAMTRRPAARVPAAAGPFRDAGRCECADAATIGVMGLFDSLFGKDEALPSQVTFTLDQAGHTYEDGSVGLLPTSLTITPDDRRVAVIGLNGAGKTTLLKLLDGAFAATSGSVSITAGETALSPAVKRDLKRIEDIVGRVRREEIPDSYYRAATIREAIEQPLKKHKVPESERLAIVGNLFAHFGLSTVARQSASSLNSEQRHLLAIASALSFSPAAIVADEPTKGLDEIGSSHVAKALFGYNKQVIFATHDVDMITRPQYAIDRALVVDDHAVVFDGEPAAATAFYEDLIRSKVAR